MSTPNDWHRLSAEEVLALLQVGGEGLAAAEVTRRRAECGPNRLPEAPTRSAWLRFLAQFDNILIYVLIGAAVLTAVLGHLLDSAVIVAVVLVNALIGYLQEGKAEQAMAAIRQMLAPRAAVRRDGRRQTVDAAELVPGDLVLLEAGDKVPADLRLIEVHGLAVQEAILTGESVAVEKQLEAVPADAALGDRTCLAFSGTTVTQGQGAGVVIATGARTEIGRISALLSTVEPLSTPLVEQMAVFARWLTLFILALAALVLAYGYFVLHQPFVELFMIVVGLSVAAIPEGLPAVLTITLAVGVKAMARRNAIVRRLPAIETVGSVNVICSDKTGTLTRNEMSVASVIAGGRHYRIVGEGYAPEGEVLDEQGRISDRAPLSDLARAALLCNDAELLKAEGYWQVSGDPMEGALLAFASRVLDAAQDERKHHTRTDLIPFDARHRFMATLHHDHLGHAAIWVKGAPERVIAMCAAERGAEGVERPLAADAWRAAAEEIAAAGQRVLALAMRRVPPEHTVLELADVEGHLVLLGLVGLIDPPRAEAIAAVAECRAAGIAVKMITGDHARTAAAIARQIGLEHPDAVLTGVELDALDEAELRERVLEVDVYARTSPEHKLRLVMALQAHGLTVAMTGDGVNDAPALKRADAGVAMGRSGSEAAKEAADLVLADDNFASIVAAVREGRTVWDNIRKVISWTLPTNAGEAATILVALLLGMALPLTPVQILWVNMITAVTLGIALAFEPTEPDTMRQPPRRRDQPILSLGLVWQVLLVATLFCLGVFGIFRYAVDAGHSVELARTLAMNALVVFELFYLFYVRKLHGTSFTVAAIQGTPAVWMAIAVVAAGQFAITYIPSLQRVFGTAAVPLGLGVVVVLLGLVLLAVIEIEKQLRLRVWRAAPRMRPG
jgi:magnesium-transporting ATPase (P-type)